MRPRPGSVRTVLVLNHFAVPAGQPGGTRHVELLTRLDRWSGEVIASNRNLLTGRTSGGDGPIRFVWTAPYTGNGPSRILNWCSYAVTALVAGLGTPRLTVVYASSPHLLAGAAGWLLARLRRRPFVLEIRDLWPQVLVDMGQITEDARIYRVLRALERFLYRRAVRIVVLSAGVRKVLLGEHRVPAEKVILIPNGADPEDFEVAQPREALRRQFGMQRFTFVYAGAHGPANGLSLLLDAAAEVRDELPEVGFLLVGDGAEKQDLMSAAAARGLSNVRFLDPLPKSEVPKLLAAADCGLHVLADVPLFRYGVSPNKLFDYMAAGLPVITNTPGEVADLVEEAGAGAACAPHELAQAIRQITKASARQRQAWGTSGRDFIARTRSRTALARRLEALLDDVAERARSGR